MTDTADEVTRVAKNPAPADKQARFALFAVEVQALARMMPGVAVLSDDEEIERGFDNMPV